MFFSETPKLGVVRFELCFKVVGAFQILEQGFLRVRSIGRFEVFLEGLFPQIIEGLRVGHVWLSLVADALKLEYTLPVVFSWNLSLG